MNKANEKPRRRDDEDMMSEVELQQAAHAQSKRKAAARYEAKRSHNRYGRDDNEDRKWR